MKKILTLLLLSALFFVPRSASAVHWEVSDGTQYRINPNNPSDPNDSILIPAGTKFVRLMCGRDNSNNREFIVFGFTETINEGRQLRMIYIDEEPSSYNGKYFISTRYLSGYDINFPDDALRFRLTERIFGYDYLRITYGGSMGASFGFRYESPEYPNSYSIHGYSTLDAVTFKQRLRYLYKIVLTEDEVLSTKSLNFDPQEYGISFRNYVGIRRINGLEIFKNLEELYLQRNPSLGTAYETYEMSTFSHAPFLPDFLSFPKLKVLDLSDIRADYGMIRDGGHFYSDGNRCNFTSECLKDLPKSIEYIYLRNSNVVNALSLSDEYVNVKKIDATGNPNLRFIRVSSSSLDTLLVNNCSRLNELICVYGNLVELDVSGCSSLQKLNCYDNMLESLTLSGNTILQRLECQNNNLDTLILDIGTPAVYGVRPSVNSYYEFDGNNAGFCYVYNNYNVQSSGDTVYNWSKYRFELKDEEYYEEYDSYYDEYYEIYANDYIDSLGKYVYFDNNSYSSVSNPSLPVEYVRYLKQKADHPLLYLDCSKNNIASLQLCNALRLQRLYCYNNNLTELDLTSCTSLQRLRMSHNKIPQIDVSNCKELVEIYAKNRIGEPGFASWNHGLTSLDCSGLTKLETVRLSRNKMTSLNMSGCSSLQTLTCDNQGGSDARTLEVLNLTGCGSLNSLDCQNNALTSLDLSTCTSLAPSGVKAYVQRAVKDVKVIDRDKVCIELVNGVTPTIEDNSTISDTHMDNYFGTWTGSGFDKTRNRVIKRDGKTYLVIYDISNDARGGTQTKYDVDYYGKKLKYQYAIGSNSWDETLGGSLANGKKTDNVTVTIYPYVMYVNPLSKDIHSEEVTQQGKEPFYSGTIYLDYDAIVPAGATAYIAKKIKINQNLIYSTAGGGHQKVTADQLQLVPLVAGEGASEVVIPAYTPVYVKSDTEFGLFSFDRNNHGGIEQALGYAQDGSHLTKDNILRGVLTDSAITKYSVLSLGRGRPKGSDDNGYTTESRIGFWPFSGTTIPAHRVFIPIGELENAGVNNNSPGLLFSFINDIDDNTTTGIRTAASAKKNEGWYTINGVRLTGRPTEKGVYIHNGRKEVIR